MFFEINKDIFGKLPIVMNSVGECPKQVRVFLPDGHPYHEIIWVKRGAGAFFIDGSSAVLEEGQGVFMRSGVPHEYYGDEFSTGWCTFSMPEAMLDYIGADRVFFFNVPPFLDSENDRLHELAQGGSTPLERSAALYSYLMDFFGAVLEEDKSLSTRVIRFLEAHYSEQLTLESVARAVGVDQFTLCRSFMNERGNSVMNELKRIRIAKAKRLLRYSSESIESVGRLCGFESPSYFGKRFREMCGKSPSEYRRG